jgi:hypothetical protein
MTSYEDYRLQGRPQIALRSRYIETRHPVSLLETKRLVHSERDERGQ